jgi:hypothetical protein
MVILLQVTYAKSVDTNAALDGNVHVMSATVDYQAVPMEQSAANHVRTFFIMSNTYEAGVECLVMKQVGMD